MGFCHTQLDGSPDPYSSEYEKSPPKIDSYVREKNQRAASERQELFRKRVAIPDAVGDNVPAAFPATPPTSQTGVTAPSGSGMHRQNLLVAALLIVAGVLAVRKLAPDIGAYFNQKFNPWVLAPSTAANFSAGIRAEDEAFSEFLVAFRTGPSAMPGTSPFGVNSPTERNLVDGFFANTPRLIKELQRLLQEIGRSPSDGARRKLLADLHREVRTLKGEADRSELLPVWQLASALEGLLKQLIDRAGNITLSTLRTVNGGVDLLEDLCAPGLKADLLTNPPIRLLAVDDNLISRKALSLALKKALNPPDLAENGEAALALATEHAYDVIFLDVQMPGMDGFEVCTRIHETVPNSTTPVVFVTCLSDFEARAQSTLSGGSDLISKPFLTFEVTVKAITLALRGRLQGRARIAGAHTASNGSKAVSPALAQTSPARIHQQELCEDTVKPALPERLTDGQHQDQLLTNRDGFVLSPPDLDPAGVAQRTPAMPATAMPNADRSNSSCELSPEELTQAFLARVTTHLEPLRDLIQTIFQTTDANERQEMLADFYIRFNSLTPKFGSAAVHPALRVSAALEGLVKKLLQDPKHCTSSTLVTVATAVDLLNDLCAIGLNPDMATNPPIRILAVDDDPVSRRALTCALQMAFEKPVSVDSGEAALALASEKPFDVIFLDVEMPGMDGFTTCLRIHETVHNRTTPVVFVTGHSDFKARSQSTVSGGSDLIGKPFLTAEISVKVLTYALRGRLQKLKSSVNMKQFQSGNGQPRNDLIPALPENTSALGESRPRSRHSKPIP
jgi:CheY-like chemotaxis protein